MPYLRAAAVAGDTDKLIRFVRLHLGNEDVGRGEIDKSWIEVTKILLRDQPVDEGLIAQVMSAEESSLARLYFHLHFYFIKRSGEWIHDGSRQDLRGPAQKRNAATPCPVAHGQRALSRLHDRKRKFR